MLQSSSKVAPGLGVVRERVFDKGAPGLGDGGAHDKVTLGGVGAGRLAKSCRGVGARHVLLQHRETNGQTMKYQERS